MSDSRLAEMRDELLVRQYGEACVVYHHVIRFSDGLEYGVLVHELENEIIRRLENRKAESKNE